MTHTPGMVQRMPNSSTVPAHGASMRLVVGFLSRLRALPPVAWQQALAALDGPERDARAHARTTDSVAEELADYAARRRLRLALEAMPMIVPSIRARVDRTLGALAGVLPATTLTRLRRAVRLAALALAAQPLLRPEDVARLCRPFENLVPQLQPQWGS